MIDDVLSNRKAWFIAVGDCIEVMRRLPDGCVQCCVTSPPYFSLRDYGCEGQIGLEATPEAYVAKMLEVFREVHRILRQDGTLWLNIGDSYHGSWGNSGSRPELDGKTQGQREKDVAYLPRGGWDERRERPASSYPLEGYKPKDLYGIPWQLAFALRNDGWYLRSEVIWAKKAPMPESVTDRPTKAHEQVFLLTKSSRYFYDEVAGREVAVKGAAGSSNSNKRDRSNGNSNGLGASTMGSIKQSDGRNMRSVWTLGPESFSGAHFATMPTELARRCLLAGTSEKGCCERCGTPWRRTTAKERKATRPGTDSKVNGGSMVVGNRDPYRHCTVTTTTGWEPGCQCDQGAVPCLVFDPFGGAGTTLLWRAN